MTATGWPAAVRAVCIICNPETERDRCKRLLPHLILHGVPRDLIRFGIALPAAAEPGDWILVFDLNVRLRRDFVERLSATIAAEPAADIVHLAERLPPTKSLLGPTVVESCAPGSECDACARLVRVSFFRGSATSVSAAPVARVTPPLVSRWRFTNYPVVALLQYPCRVLSPGK